MCVFAVSLWVACLLSSAESLRFSALARLRGSLLLYIPYVRDVDVHIWTGGRTIFRHCSGGHMTFAWGGGGERNSRPSEL